MTFPSQGGADHASAGYLEEWIRTYSPRLLPIARSFAVGAEEAEDLLQEVWMIAAKKATRIPQEMEIGPWLYTLTLNVCRSYQRKEKRRRLLALQRPPLPREPGPPTIDDELKRQRLWRAVAELPKLQRSVVLLRFVEGVSTAQAAHALDRAEGTIKASLAAAVLRLRSELGESANVDHEVGDGLLPAMKRSK